MRVRPVLYALLLTHCMNAFAHKEKKCEPKLLPANHAISPWLHFRATSLKKHAGFEMRRPEATGRVEITMEDPDSIPFLKSTTWHSPKSYFTLVDSGFRRLEAVSQQVNHLALRHLMDNPDLNLRVTFGRSLRDRISVLSKFRWQVHDAVLRRYSSKKDYLDKKDLFLLKFGNVWSSNSDVFALLNGSTFSIHESLTSDELNRRLAMAIQISYFGDENYLKPTSRGILRPLGLDQFADSFDLLPFEYRLSEEQRLPLREELSQVFDLRHSCEIGRYAKFQPLPISTQQKFLLHVFATIRKRGMKTIFAAGDANTIRLFRRYGFKSYGQLPGRRPDEPEFLTYLDVESPEFERLLHRLSVDSKGTETVGGISDD